MDLQVSVSTVCPPDSHSVGVVPEQSPQKPHMPSTMSGFPVVAFFMTAVAHQGWELPPSVVQLLISTPLYQKGN